MWQQWMNFVLGLVILTVSLFTDMSNQATWTLAALGAAVAVFSIWGAQETADEREEGRMMRHHRHA
ncbi:hypothetical protein KC902_01925 [Candidatus Kaiserbacteria bacterium]|nr:hypothetical protein [Candidatus Kaiserbacteria bacterium]USN88835.1 MAG: hypothetical protein H6780_00205 [Candidatus Nomurabacteria bacterium]